MPTVLDWNATVDPSEVVRQVGEALAAGSSVVLPGDAGYVVLLNPAGPDALLRNRHAFDQPNGRAPEAQPALPAAGLARVSAGA